MSDDNVIQFKLSPRNPSDLPVTVKPHDFAERCLYDTHRRMSMDEDTQLLQCKDCQKVISAWTWLRTLAYRDMQIDFKFDELKQKVKEKAAELAKIERQLANAKARLRRLNAPDSTTAGS
jgi:hypothetical protein